MSAEQQFNSISRVFVSYSWDSLEHKQWVVNFAAKLRSDRLDVILDEWNLGPGDDKNFFMETSVTKSDFVLLVCTPNYAKKANERRGGVGYESMIITAEIAERIDQNKFIPVLRSGDFATALPCWIKSRVGVDLRGEQYSPDEYNKLLRALHRQPVVAPPLGQSPNFLQASSTPTGSETSSSALSQQDRDARFRKNGDPLGIMWHSTPFSQSVQPVTLADGPAIWLRVIPKEQTTRTWTMTELKDAGTKEGSWLLPFCGDTFRSLRADDGLGTYVSSTPTGDQAFAVAFAFETGEVWSIDTELLSYDKQIFFSDFAKRLTSRLPDYAGFLNRLGIAGPYRWIAGMTGVQGYGLSRPNRWDRPACVSDTVVADGLFSIGDDPKIALQPIFRRLFDKCGVLGPVSGPIAIE